MTRFQSRFTGVVIGLAVIGAVPVLRAAGPRQQPAQYRARVEVVSVDVLVRASGKPVVGLTSSDFELRDNGVVQQIDAISAGAVPVDLTLVMDVSGSTVGLVEAFKDEIRQIAKLLRPEDRIRLVTVATDVREVFPFRPASGRLPMDHLETGGSTSLDDGLLFALLHTPDAVRRHLIVVFTDGGENSSAIDGGGLALAAKYSQSILHIVVSDPLAELNRRLVPQGMRVQVFSQPIEAAPLRALAEMTGGELHDTESSSNIVQSFKKVFDDFRGSYVLRYTPRDVASPGWHELSVIVTKAGKYTIQARKGYFGG